MRFHAPGINGLRVIMTGCVIRYHEAKVISSFDTKGIGYRDGRLMVPFFFLLSGFFAYMSLSRMYEKRNSLSSWLSWLSSSVTFILRRSVPVMLISYFLHLVYVMTMSPDDWKVPPGWRRASEPIFYRWYIRWWGVPSSRYPPSIAMWYISVQILLWVLTPILILPLMKYRRRQYGTRVMAAVAILIDFGMIWIAPSDVSLPQVYQDSVYCAPILRLPTYFCGMALGCCVLEPRRRSGGEDSLELTTNSSNRRLVVIGLLFDSLVVLGVMSIAFVFRHRILDYRSVMVAEAYAFNWFFIIVVTGLTAASSYKSIINRFLSSRWMQKQSGGGSLTLMYYLLHLPVGIWMGNSRASKHLAQIVVLTYLLGGLLHAAVYRPLHTLTDRLQSPIREEKIPLV